MRQEWVASGRDSDDLSFTLLGMYEIAAANGPLIGYANELAAIAAVDPQVSFVNVMNHGPSYAVASQLGYLPDGLHPTRAGALVYGEAAVAALVPEPASGVAALLALLGFASRRRR